MLEDNQCGIQFCPICNTAWAQGATRDSTGTAPTHAVQNPVTTEDKTPAEEVGSYHCDDPMDIKGQMKFSWRRYTAAWGLLVSLLQPELAINRAACSVPASWALEGKGPALLSCPLTESNQCLKCVTRPRTKSFLSLGKFHFLQRKINKCIREKKKTREIPTKQNTTIPPLNKNNQFAAVQTWSVGQNMSLKSSSYC